MQRPGSGVATTQRAMSSSAIRGAMPSATAEGSSRPTGFGGSASTTPRAPHCPSSSSSVAVATIDGRREAIPAARPSPLLLLLRQAELPVRMRPQSAAGAPSLSASPRGTAASNNNPPPQPRTAFPPPQGGRCTPRSAGGHKSTADVARRSASGVASPRPPPVPTYDAVVRRQKEGPLRQRTSAVAEGAAKRAAVQQDKAGPPCQNFIADLDPPAASGSGETAAAAEPSAALVAASQLDPCAAEVFELLRDSTTAVEAILGRDAGRAGDGDRHRGVVERAVAACIAHGQIARRQHHHYEPPSAGSYCPLGFVGGLRRYDVPVALRKAASRVVAFVPALRRLWPTVGRAAAADEFALTAIDGRRLFDSLRQAYRELHEAAEGHARGGRSGPLAGFALACGSADRVLRDDEGELEFVRPFSTYDEAVLDGVAWVAASTIEAFGDSSSSSSQSNQEAFWVALCATAVGRQSWASLRQGSVDDEGSVTGKSTRRDGVKDLRVLLWQILESYVSPGHSATGTTSPASVREAAAAAALRRACPDACRGRTSVDALLATRLMMLSAFLAAMPPPPVDEVDRRTSSTTTTTTLPPLQQLSAVAPLVENLVTRARLGPHPCDGLCTLATV